MQTDSPLVGTFYGVAAGHYLIKAYYSNEDGDVYEGGVIPGEDPIFVVSHMSFIVCIKGKCPVMLTCLAISTD